MRRRSWWLAVVCGVVAFSSNAVLAQVTADNSPPRVVLGDENRKAAEGLQKLSSGDEEQIRKHLNALLPKADEIRPMPLPEIPSDPPPHEGQMLDYPRVIAPPDLMVIEVLEALPGRPITGERLVRPNGTISLDFYGDVHVRGLTVKEAKAKVILHLRSFLNDEVLGLVGLDPETGGLVAIAPEDSNRVFVDITSYNSTPCYVQGEVASPSRLPCTGGDTVLDVINYAGGLSEKADRDNIKLVRPGRDGQPAHVYRIDLEAITTHGDPKANLQLFPGDRLLIGKKSEQP